jgi:hypothetical protein
MQCTSTSPSGTRHLLLHSKASADYMCNDDLKIMQCENAISNESALRDMYLVIMRCGQSKDVLP